jgi:sulfatase modifying factor 1
MSRKNESHSWNGTRILAAGALPVLVMVTLFRMAWGDPSGGAGSVSACGEMVVVPGGEFVMGTNDGGDDNPPHTVRVDTFYMDRCEVTNAQYSRFCEDTGRPLPMFWGMDTFHCGPNYPDHPVVGVSWRDATAYAKWCGKRLPTEAEWEYAARGGLAGGSYPLGDTLTPADANYTKSGRGGTAPVGSYPANGVGLYDTAGNVVEWINDWYNADYYTTSPYSNPGGPEKGRFRVIRGGGWHSGPSCNRVYYRNALPPNWLDFNVGFRCAGDYAVSERE